MPPLPSSMGKIPVLLSSLLLLKTSSTRAQPQVYTPQLTPLNPGRPTFYDPSTSIAGKIALEEHVSSTLFPGIFTTPFVSFTNEVNFDLPIYQQDVIPQLQNINSHIAAMDSANISISVLMFGPDGIQGVFNSTFATYAASFINDEMASIYKHGNHSGRFEFWCNNALQDPVSAAVELERCVKVLGGVGSFVGGYTNMGSANNITYLDDPIKYSFPQESRRARRPNLSPPEDASS